MGGKRWEWEVPQRDQPVEPLQGAGPERGGWGSDAGAVAWVPGHLDLSPEWSDYINPTHPWLLSSSLREGPTQDSLPPRPRGPLSRVLKTRGDARPGFSAS